MRLLAKLNAKMLVRLSNTAVSSSVYPVSKHLIPIFILIIYSFLGGWIFLHLEGNAYGRPKHNDNRSTSVASSCKSSELHWKSLFETLVNNLTEILKQNNESTSDNASTTALISSTPSANVFVGKIKVVLTNKEYVTVSQDSNSVQETEPLESAISQLLADILSRVDKKSSLVVEKPPGPPENPWNIWNATLYAATLYTTIGYGNIACQTVGGRVVTMLYAIVGIPLVLTVLTDLGSLLFQCFEKLHIEMRYLLWRLKVSELPDNVGEITFTSAFLLLVVWMCTSAGIFLLWEDNWDYFTSFYFFFITFTTIGLGDVTPDKPGHTLGAFIFILCGLAIVSMFITIIQAKIESLFQSLITNIDTEYRQKVLDSPQSRMDDNEFAGGFGLMDLYKQKPLKERILYSLMDKYKKDMLEQYWRKKQGTRNKHVQTEKKIFGHQEIQVDMENDENETKMKFRKYIYNLDD